MVGSSSVVEVYDKDKRTISLACFEGQDIAINGWCYTDRAKGRFGICQRSCKFNLQLS